MFRASMPFMLSVCTIRHVKSGWHCLTLNCPLQRAWTIKNFPRVRLLALKCISEACCTPCVMWEDRACRVQMIASH